MTCLGCKLFPDIESGVGKQDDGVPVCGWIYLLEGTGLAVSSMNCDVRWVTVTGTEDGGQEKVMIALEWNTLGECAGRNCRNVPAPSNL